jgi:hypothetical protein
MVGSTVEDRPRILYLLVATARETPHTAGDLPAEI